MNLDKETQEKIQELQSYEQTLHSLLIQKQAFQIELTETENAFLEIGKSKDDIFKLVGNIMVKAEKKKVEEELKRKKGLLSLRLKSIESQESSLINKAEELKKEVMKKIK
ncbi:MAG: prefoldin subunit [Nanoarchaeota archaeon]